nr:uncharacterized protein LOC113722293 [Coffea arabica]
MPRSAYCFRGWRSSILPSEDNNNSTRLKMVHQESEVDVSTSNLSAEDNVAAETTLVGTELSNHPVGMDVMPTEIVPQSEHKVENTLDELENESKDEENVNEESGKGEGPYDDEDEEDDDVDYDYDDNDDDALMEEGSEIENKENDMCEVKDNNKSTTGEESENEEKECCSLAPKMKKVGNKNGRNKVVNEELGKLASKREAKLGGGEHNVPIVREDEKNARAEIEEKGEGSANKKGKKSRKRNRRKVKEGNAEKVASKSKDKLKPSGKKRTLKKAASMGMIFMCSSKTKRDCYRYKVLGLPANKRDIVEKVYKGMRLFLYDVDLKLMYGIYKAAGPGGYNIEPKAFKSQFPSQVRFIVMEDCIPLAEDKFKKVIKENYFTRTKFDCQLKSEQVRKLCKLFVAVSKRPRSQGLDRGFKEKTYASIGQDRLRVLDIDEERRSALDEKRQYPRIHQREVIASPLDPVHRFAPLRPPAAAPLYAYDRSTERDAYRQNLLSEHRDSYRRRLLESRDAYRWEPYGQPLLDSRDSYRRERSRQSPLQSPDVYREDTLLDHRENHGWDGVVEHLNPRPLKLEARHRDDIAMDDPYILYRERQLYRDPVYIQNLSPERDCYLPVGRRYRYRSREDPLTEYRSTRSFTRARYRY